jgi:alpha-L-rhamnosidase
MKQKHTLLAFALLCMQLVNAQVKVSALRCEMLVNPLGIDVKEPRLSWELVSEERNTQQTAYQIIVASTKEKLDKNAGDLWNSGKVASSQSIQVSYAGKGLNSRAQCFWKVKTFTNKGESTWSEPASWTIGLLNKSDWQGKWIGWDKPSPWDSITQWSRLSARYFRKQFASPSSVKKATVYVVGLGLYELYINGKKQGDMVLAPNPTDYRQSVLYNTHDVTDQIKQGVNAIAVALGNGRFFTMRQNYKPKKINTFGFPKMLLQLEIEYTNGTKKIVTSDETWKLNVDGPIRTNNEYDGEEYDATKEMKGWKDVGFNDANWLKPQLVKAPPGKIVAQMSEPMKIMQTIKPVVINRLSNGTYIMDMGQNFAGWVKMNVRGKRGEKVKLRFAESLQPNGELYVANLRDARVTDSYTLKGEGTETWQPSFVYHGFRYVEITGYPGTPTTNDFEGHLVYDALQTTGDFICSDSTINKVYKNSWWGIASNYKGMPVDCPQRNERQPWLGDRTTGSGGEAFMFDNAKLYAKLLDDIQQSQTAEGAIPDVAPAFWNYYSDNMPWPSTYIFVADMLYRQFGDKRSIVKHYPSMKKWMQYMRVKYMKNYIVTKDKYGDWCVPPESLKIIKSQDSTRTTRGELIATAYYFHLLKYLQKFAKLAGKNEDIKAYTELAENIKQAFHKKFFNTQKNYYDNNTVTANIMPLYFGITPDNLRVAVVNNMYNKIKVDNQMHISTGVIGTQWLMRGLTNFGHPEVAFALASNKTYPSWGYMAENGATTIWELWNGNTANPQMNSQNHVMLLGDLIIWFYENLAGIKSDEAHPGFKQIVMNPSLVEGLNYVKASYQSVHGLVKSEWKKEATELTWNISVPGNTNAIVYIPAADAKEVMENGTIASSVDGVQFLRMEEDKAVFSVGSGNYSFRVKANFKGLATKP